jgi:hypothetical protein
VNLGEFSEPQPDLLLVVAVSDTTLAFDRGTKRELFA